jgi:hypothetical protein
VQDVLLLLTTSSSVHFNSQQQNKHNMTQTAAALSSDHALNINELRSSATLTVHTSVHPASTRTASSSHSGASNGTFYAAVSQLHYGDKVKFSYVVKDSYRSHFVLIKGLLEFHRSPAFVFSFNRQEGTFDVTLSTNRLSQPLDEFNRFLRKIAAWLDQELSFKRQLKEMRAFEQEYRAKLAKVYEGGEGYTLSPLS